MSEEHEYFQNKRTDRTYAGRRINTALPHTELTDSEAALRYVSHVFDGADGGVIEIKEHGEVTLRITSGQRYQITAKIWEDSRQIKSITIQKFNRVSGGHKEYYFTFVGEEIEKILNFLRRARDLNFDAPESIRVDDADFDKRYFQNADAIRIVADNPAVARIIAESSYVQEDLVAVGYRRQQLELFKSMLSDPEYFAGLVVNNRAEAVWQQFFEKNKWIFGYSLSYYFLDSLEGRGLEQISTGADLVSSGKRADAFMKTRALVSSICFVEIKRHDSPLLAQSAYRGGVWTPSTELTGGVSQVQTVVQSFVEKTERGFRPIDTDGNPTGEILFNIMPRSFLVIGSLNEFRTNKGINEEKFRAFELYRRNILRPDIITFDELYERARCIIGDDVSAADII